MQNSSVSGILSENGIESIKQGAGAAADLCMYFFLNCFLCSKMPARPVHTQTNTMSEMEKFCNLYFRKVIGQSRLLNTDVCMRQR